MNTWTFGKKVGLGFAVSVFALAIIASAGYRSASNLIENDQKVAHTVLVRREIAQLLTDLTNAETGQRGYVITGREDFLQPYTNALTAIDRDFDEVKRQTADNPLQQGRFEKLRSVIDQKLTEMKAVLDERKTSFEAAQAHVSQGVGKEYMDKIRSLMAEADEEEARLMEQRRIESEESTSVTKTIILWGGVAGVLMTIVAAFLVITSLTKQIGSGVRDLQSSSAELQASANQQASGATEQASAMTEIATTISELLATSRQIAESAQRVSQIASETAGAARAGSATIKRSNDATTGVRRQVDQIVAHMLDLGKKAQQIGVVLDIVSELAEQTNILAINATIEASGAGESGRRFGVVAAEIRSLADRVGASTKEIRNLIDDVRGAVNTTVMATEAGSKAVDSSAGTVADMATSFNQISSLVGTTTDAAREIELSTKQQASAVEQVNSAITNVAQSTREAEASATQVLQTSGQLTKLSTELLRIVQAS
ncbi:MAG: CHASE3 domain-containing protein [Kofleriaceae bacterium]